METLFKSWIPLPFILFPPLWISDLTDFRIHWISWCQGLWRHRDNAFEEVLPREGDHKHMSQPDGHPQTWQVSRMSQWIMRGFLVFLWDFCIVPNCPLCSVQANVHISSCCAMACVCVCSQSLAFSRLWIFPRMLEPLFNSPLPSQPPAHCLATRTAPYMGNEWVTTSQNPMKNHEKDPNTKPRETPLPHSPSALLSCHSWVCSVLGKGKEARAPQVWIYKVIKERAQAAFPVAQALMHLGVPSN